MADYKLTGEKLTLGLAAATRKMCGAPEGIMEQEQAYLSALGTVVGFHIQDAQLTLLDAEGTTVALYDVDLQSAD